MLLVCVYCVYALAEEVCPKPADLTTLLQNVSFPVALFISSVSWCLQIPVDAGGLWTVKNHFFHTANSLSCLLSMVSYKQVWLPRQAYVPLFYGIGYAAFIATSQALGKWHHVNVYIEAYTIPLYRRRSCLPIP